MTAAPKPKPRKMWGVFFKESGELLSLHWGEDVARRMAIGGLKPTFARPVLVTPIEEDADGR